MVPYLAENILNFVFRMCNKESGNTHTYKELKLYLLVVAASKRGTRGAVTQGSTWHVPKYRIWDFKKKT